MGVEASGLYSFVNGTKRTQTGEPTSTLWPVGVSSPVSWLIENEITGASTAVTLPLTLRFVALGVEKRHSLPLKARCRSGLFAAL